MTKPWWTRLLLGRTAVSNPLRSAALDEAPDAQFEAQWRALVKKRLVPILMVLALWVVAIEGRLIWIQVVQHDTWAGKAQKQQEDNIPIYLPRGDVLDRHGRTLAYSIISYDVHVNPKKAEIAKLDLDGLAHDICAALGDCDAREEASIAAKLTQPKAQDVIIRRAHDVSFDAAVGLEAFIARLETKKKQPKDFIDLRARDVRYYPNMRLAAQVIGYVKTEDDTRKGSKAAVVSGLNGVEKQFDDDLRGKPGIELRQIDGMATEIMTTVISPPTPGVTLELTIDAAVQEIAEGALTAGIERAGASSGTALVLDSSTGEVLAMANAPSFNLNRPGDAQGAERNHAIQDLNEPGSTFKTVTLSAAINEQVVTPATTFDTNPGRLIVEGRRTPITEDKGHNYGLLTVEGILVHSSNVGAAMVAMRMGPDIMLRYAEKFGFTTSMRAKDFFSERLGLINAPKGVLTKASLATVAYGYGVEASPLQLATAMNVFATGGLLLRPHLVRAVIENGVRKTQEPEIVNRAITEETAAAMTTMLEAVVEAEGGTGHAAKLDRYRVAGKTGTTKKVMPGGGGYSENDYRVSFVGFAPSRHPRFTIIVVVDEPTKLPAYGGLVAAPIFKEIAERSLNYVGEAPSVNPPPAVMVAENRTPTTRSSRPEAPSVTVNAVGVPTMPDLAGLTLRDALQRLPPGFIVNAQGSGVIVWQSPAAGEAIATDRSMLRLQSVPAKAGGAGR